MITYITDLSRKHYIALSFEYTKSFGLISPFPNLTSTGGTIYSTSTNVFGAIGVAGLGHCTGYFWVIVAAK